ncbi:MAG: peroxiredoxin [Sandaracinaceae bacterium]
MRTHALLLAMTLAAPFTACGGDAAERPAAAAAAEGGGGADPTGASPEVAAADSADPVPTRAAGLRAEGTAAPAFEAPDQSGALRTLEAERGNPVVLYFYPRDATPGCTAEACAFRDAWARYEEAGVQVFGVSTDSVESHRAFAEEHGLPFPLLADPEARIADAYGVPHIGGFMRRVTFLIDADGRIARVFDQVDPGVHAEEVLSALAAR